MIQRRGEALLLISMCGDVSVASARSDGDGWRARYEQKELVEAERCAAKETNKSDGEKSIFNGPRTRDQVLETERRDQESYRDCDELLDLPQRHRDSSLDNRAKDVPKSLWYVWEERSDRKGVRKVALERFWK